MLEAGAVGDIDLQHLVGHVAGFQHHERGAGLDPDQVVEQAGSLADLVVTQVERFGHRAGDMQHQPLGGAGGVERGERAGDLLLPRRLEPAEQVAGKTEVVR